MDELDARVARVECECISLRDALRAATLAIEANAQAAARNAEAIVAAHETARGIMSVNAELVARNVALTGGSRATTPAPVAQANTVVVRADPSGVALLGNSATYSMRQELKRYGSWLSDAPARWVIPADAWEQNRSEWMTRFGVTFAIE